MIKMTSRTWFDVASVITAVKDAGMKPLMKAGLLVEREAKESMGKGGWTWEYVASKQKGRAKGRQKQSTGKPRTRKLRVYKASEEGDVPNVRTGVLRSSIKTAATRWLTVVIGPTSPPAEYGMFLEFGTRRGLKPRPFMRPALDNTRNGFAKLWRKLALAKTKAGQRLNRRKS